MGGTFTAFLAHVRHKRGQTYERIDYRTWQFRAWRIPGPLDQAAGGRTAI